MTPCISKNRQKGIAVITAILIAAMVAALAFALSARERLWLNQLENRKDYATAQNIAYGAIELARLTLRDDMRNNQIDHLLEPWTIPIPKINVEEGKAAGRLIELQGRFNLANLQKKGKIDPNAVLALQRLLTTQGLPIKWATLMTEALADRAPTTDATVPPKKAAAAPLTPIVDVSGFALIPGLESADLKRLDSLLTLLPEPAPLNVNFADPETLAATIPGLSSHDAEAVIAKRTAHYFENVQGFINALPGPVRANVKTADFTVESQYFLAETEAWFGRAHVRYLAMISRTRNTEPIIIWVRRI